MTLEELAKLSPEEKRIKIAEACGYYNCEGKYGSIGNLPYMVEIPDYLNSLDAMHEAEKILDMPGLSEYINQLDSYPQHGRLTTAFQRANSFLLALVLK